MSTSMYAINERKALLIRGWVNFPTSFKLYDKLEFLVISNLWSFGFHIATGLDIAFIII